MKRLRAIRLFFCVMTFAIALPLVAAKAVVGNYTWTYRISGSTAEIYNNGYAAISPSPKGVVTIPDTLDGKTVVSIGERAFINCDMLTTVAIPDSVKNIGAYAFNGCHEFSNVNIPDSVTNIEDCAFCYCGSLTSVSIGKGVVSVGASAFYGCGKLASVTIGDGVTKIGSDAFSGCSEILYDTATIPGVKLLDGWVVGYTDSLSDDLNLVAIRGIGDYTFWNCRGLTSLTIQDSVASIGDGAFCGCSGLMNVVIGGGVTSIGEDAFSGCDGLASVTIPDSVMCVGDDAFFDCSGLTNVVIGGGVTGIGGSAFYGCSGLTSVTIPDGVTSIGGGAFAWCSGLTSVTIPGCVTQLSDMFPSAYQAITNVVMSRSVTNIASCAFSDCSELTSVTIPDSVTNIGSYAFSGCSGLTSVTIPNSVTSIGDYVFSGCRSLTHVTIPDSVTNIGANAFYYCTGLRNVKIGNSVTRIEDYTFYYCGGLTNVIMGNSVTSIGNRSFSDCSGLTSVTIPNGVTSIGWNAFDNCSGLKTMTIPNGVTNIGISAFYCCGGLTSVTIPSSVTSVGTSAFGGCSSLSRVYLPLSFGGSTDVFPRSATIIRYKPVQTVTLDVADGVVSSEFVSVDYGGKYGALPIPSLTGRSFIGWMSNGNWVSDETIVQELDDHVLVAQWQVNQYTVTFDANGGEGGESEQMDYGSVIVPPTVTRQYYDFVGWLPEVDSTVPASNVTYRAQWRPVSMKVLCAYPFRRHVDHTRESGFFGCAIPANVITNVDAQPLLGEWFGIQVQVDTSGMADIDLESIEVHMAWFAGESPWGWTNWIGNATVNDVVLDRAADWAANNLVYRSNPNAQDTFIPPQFPRDYYGCQTVQYHIWMTFKDKDGNLQDVRNLGDFNTDWTRPDWYDPVDKNKDHGAFSAYTILDEISPRRVWLNEINMYQCGNLNDAVHQFIEIAAPMGYDLTGWSVSAVQANNSGYSLNTLFTMGYNGVPSWKIGPNLGSYVFYAIQSPETKEADTYGALDGVWRWDAFGRYGMDIGSPCALRLCRPNGIIEHEIVFMCTNAHSGRFAWMYDGTNFLKNVKENVQPGDANQWFYAGADDQGCASVDYSLGVYTGHGEENAWTNMMVQTPGEANRLADGSQQFIDPNYLCPPSDAVLFIYATVKWNGSYGVSIGSEDTGITSAVIITPQNFDGTFTTNIAFHVEDGFEIDNVTTNGGIVAEASGKTGVWILNVNLFNSDLRKFDVLASARLVGGSTDSIPAIATDATPNVVAAALYGAADPDLTANITNATQYANYRTWALSVTNSTITAQTVKESTSTWLSYALGAGALIGKEITSEDVKIESFTPSSTDGKFEFTVSVKDVNIGGGSVTEAVLKENLKKVLGIEGAKSLSSGAFSPDNIDITFDTPVDGKAKVTVSPPNDAGNSFFMRVKVK